MLDSKPIPNDIIVREIRRIVLRASGGSGFIRAGDHAYRLWKAYPECGITPAQLVNEITVTAARAGVAVEIHQPTAA